MTHRFSLVVSLLLIPCSALCQVPAISLPAGTPLPVQIGAHLPMRIGQPIRAQLIYPVYTFVPPTKTIVTGTVTALRSNHSRRISARLRCDFTPFNIPIVHFTGITLTDGSTVPITTDTATDSSAIDRLVAPPPRKGGFIRQQCNNAFK